YLVRIGEKRGVLGNAMSVASQAQASRLRRLDLLVSFRDHLARDSLVLNMSVAVSEALPLLPNLSGRHRDRAGAVDQFFYVLRHGFHSPQIIVQGYQTPEAV